MSFNIFLDKQSKIGIMVKYNRENFTLVFLILATYLYLIIKFYYNVYQFAF